MAGGVTLHEELAEILRERRNQWTRVSELTAAVNERARYLTRRRIPVVRLSVDSRTRQYPNLFERDGSRVRLSQYQSAAAEAEGQHQLALGTEPIRQRKLHLPILESLELSRFSLYRNLAEIQVNFGNGVFCLAGANGLGKSTFLSAINFGLTGIVADPGRKFESLGEYYSKSLAYSASYFHGRISEFDRDAATISLAFRIGEHRYSIVRGMFEPQALRSLSIVDGAGSSVSPDEVSDEDRHVAYTNRLLVDTGLSTFEQFVFLQHFLFTFDERRHLLFWDERIAEQALYIAFGIDYSRAAQADKWRRQAERNDSQARNNQYQATAARQHLEDLQKRSQAADGTDQELVAEHRRLVEARDQASRQLDTIREQLADAQLEFETAFANRSTAEREYDESFRSRLFGAAHPRFHPTVRDAVDSAHCEICNAQDLTVAAQVRDRLANHVCPMCGTELVEETTDPAALEGLRALDAALALASSEETAASMKRDRLGAELEVGRAQVDELNEQIAELETKNERLRPGAVPVADSLEMLIEQYRQEIDNALRRKEEFRVRQHEALQNLQEVQADLRSAYAAAELDFVPRFAALARRFLGLELDVGLGSREGSVRLVLAIEGSRRRTEDQLSESQRYFIEIAMRMALAQHMAAPGTPSTLYIDTPEGSLDIAYESRAGDMFGQFVADGHDIVMTANINTSQLLLELARRCGREGMKLVRMTDWTTLSDVQVSAEGLFDQAFGQIEAALSEGPALSEAVS